MKSRTKSEIDIMVTGEMSVEDAGKVAIINAKRELWIDVSKAIFKYGMGCIALWKSPELVIPIIEKLL